MASVEQDGVLTKQITGHAIAAYHAAYGFNLLAYGRLSLSNPCNLNPLWNLKYVTLIPNHVIKPATAVIFWNHPNTRPEPLLMPMYARKAKRELKRMAT